MEIHLLLSMPVLRGVIHPTCVSHVHRAQSLLGAAQRAEKKKNDKYLEKSTEVGAKFVPFVFETFGGLGKQAREFLRTIALFAHENSFIISPHEIMTSLRNSIACALQKGNAMIVRHATVRASRKAEQEAVAPLRAVSTPLRHRRVAAANRAAVARRTQSQL
jgi:hypothetical protein